MVIPESNPSIIVFIFSYIITFFTLKTEREFKDGHFGQIRFRIFKKNNYVNSAEKL